MTSTAADTQPLKKKVNSYEYTVTPAELQQEQAAFEAGEGAVYNNINTC